MTVAQTRGLVERPPLVRPDRRQLIIESALEVIAEHGVEGMTHRRVASFAGVTLSATTYYFDTIEGLLIAALAEAAERELRVIEELVAELPQDADMAKFIAESIIDRMARDRRYAIVATELYTAALRRPELREVTIAWETRWFDLLAPRLGARATDTVNVMFSGIVQSALIRDQELDLEQLQELLRRIIAACQDDAPTPAGETPPKDWTAACHGAETPD